MPLTWQKYFHRSRAWGRVGGGAFGCGKSVALVLEALWTAFRTDLRGRFLFPETRICFVRQTLGDLIGSTMKVFFQDILGVTMEDAKHHPLISHINRQEHWLRFVNGVEVYWCGAKDSGGRRSGGALSKEFGLVLFDEIVEISENSFLDWIGRLRHPSGPGRWCAATNPAANWVKNLFHPSSEDRIPGVDFFQATTSENVHLRADYERRLRATYPESWVRRFLDGSWDVFEGQVFTEWDARRHVRAFDLPAPGFWREWGCLDHGFRNPTAFTMHGMDSDDVWHVWGEHYAREMLPEEHAPIVKQRLDARKVQLCLADPSVRNVMATGRSVQDMYRESGLNLTLADHSERKNAHILALKSVMKEDGPPAFQVHPQCVNTIREIAGYRWKNLTPSREEYLDLPEEPVKKDDHAVDTILDSVPHAAVGGYKQKGPESPEDRMARAIKKMREKKRVRTF